MEDQQILDAITTLREDVIERIEASDRLTASNHKHIEDKLRGIDNKVAVTNGQVAAHVVQLHQAELRQQALENRVQAISNLQMHHSDSLSRALREHILEYHPAESVPTPDGKRRRKVPVWDKMSTTQQHTVKVTAIIQAICLVILQLIEAGKFNWLLGLLK